MYVPELHSHTEHTPLLPGPGGLSSEGTQQLRMMPRQLASEDTYRRDYLVFVQNIPSALHTPEDSPALTPCPSLQVEDDVRRKWANLQVLGGCLRWGAPGAVCVRDAGEKCKAQDAVRSALADACPSPPPCLPRPK